MKYLGNHDFGVRKQSDIQSSYRFGFDEEIDDRSIEKSSKHADQQQIHRRDLVDPFRNIVAISHIVILSKLGDV